MLIVLPGSPEVLQQYKALIYRCWRWGLLISGVIALAIYALSPDMRGWRDLGAICLVMAFLAPIFGLLVIGIISIFVRSLRWLLGH